MLERIVGVVLGFMLGVLLRRIVDRIWRKSHDTENVHNEKSGPGGGTRQGSLSSQGTAQGMADQPGC